MRKKATFPDGIVSTGQGCNTVKIKAVARRKQDSIVFDSAECSRFFRPGPSRGREGSGRSERYGRKWCEEWPVSYGYQAIRETLCQLRLRHTARLGLYMTESKPHT